jgi:predicted DNA-binding protein (MmcQ/YjbR family)
MNTDFIESICTSFKGTTQDVKWEDHLCYLVGEKMYCVTSLSQEFSLSMKVLPEEFESLITRNGVKQAAYMAKNQWIHISNPSAFTRQEWEHYLRQSYELIFSKLTKKLQKSILES